MAKTIEEKAAEEKAAEEKAAEEKAAAEKVEAEKAAKEKAAKEKAAEVVVKIEVPKVEEGKEYNSEEVKKMINDAMANASQTTKGQLRDDIAKLEAKITDLEKVKPAQVDKEKTEAEKSELAKLVETLKMQVTTLEEGFIDERQKTLVLEETLKKEKLDAVRNEIIEKANGHIIPELVVGNTKEELEASAKNAIDRYEAVWRSQRKAMGLPETEVSVNTGENKDEYKKIERIGMDNEQRSNWGNKRNAIKAQIRKELGFNN